MCSQHISLRFRQFSHLFSKEINKHSASQMWESGIMTFRFFIPFYWNWCNTQFANDSLNFLMVQTLLKPEVFKWFSEKPEYVWLEKDTKCIFCKELRKAENLFTNCKGASPSTTRLVVFVLLLPPKVKKAKSSLFKRENKRLI